MNVLDIDLNNAYDFKRDWQIFQESRVKRFLMAWLLKELKGAYCVLENVAPPDLGKVQGSVIQIRKMLTLIEKRNCEDSLKETLAYLEINKER